MSETFKAEATANVALANIYLKAAHFYLQRLLLFQECIKY